MAFIRSVFEKDIQAPVCTKPALRRRSMTPSRKRPQCQKCGQLMQGHKRPNGIVMCPNDKVEDPDEPILISYIPAVHSPLQREIELDNPAAPPFILGSGQVLRYRNPNWDEPDRAPLPYIPRPLSGSEREDSWVSTEPADDIPRIKRERSISTMRDLHEIEVIRSPSAEPSTSSSIMSSSSHSSRLRRSFTNILSNGVPLLSLFSAPKEDVSRITSAARRNGLHTGILRRPTLSAVKEESQDSRSARPRKSWWVVLGTDPEAVEHLMDMQERDQMARMEARETPGPSQPPPQHSGHNPFQFTLLGVLGLVFFAAVTAVIVVFIVLSLV